MALTFATIARRSAVILAALLALLAAVGASLAIGAVDIPLSTVIDALLGRVAAEENPFRPDREMVERPLDIL